MVKLYFKKLLLIFCLLLMWFAVSAFIATALGLGNDLINYTAYALCMVASGVISTVAAGVIKARDLMTKVEYVTEALVNRPKFWGEVRRILKSKPFIAEILGFATILAPLMVYVCTFPENAALPLYKKNIGGVACNGGVDRCFCIARPCRDLHRPQDMDEKILIRSSIHKNRPRTPSDGFLYFKQHIGFAVFRRSETYLYLEQPAEVIHT